MQRSRHATPEIMANSGDTKLRERLINLVGSLYLMTRKKKNTANKARVTILNYHRISGSSFRKHLNHIRLHYQVLSPLSFLDWLDDKDVIDRPSVLLTFDDGYMSFYEQIHPILKKTDIPVFMFLPTGCIGNSSYFWFDELQMALQKTNVRAIIVGGKNFYLHSRIYRSDFYANVLQYVSSLDQGSRREICKHILAQLNVNVTEDDMTAHRFMDWTQILEMDKTGLVEFGSHTVNHPKLTSLSNDTLRFELQESKRVLEYRLGKPVVALAYPYGGTGFFDRRIIDESGKAGYSCAFTTIQGAIEDRTIDRFGLKRVMLFDYQNEGAVALKIDRCGT